MPAECVTATQQEQQNVCWVSGRLDLDARALNKVQAHVHVQGTYDTNRTGFRVGVYSSHALIAKTKRTMPACTYELL